MDLVFVGVGLGRGGGTPHNQQCQTASSSSGNAATDTSINNVEPPSGGSVAEETTNQTQDRSDDEEDLISSFSPLEHNSPDRQDRGHSEEIGGQDQISVGSGDTPLGQMRRRLIGVAKTLRNPTWS